jgi:hypothetical protein
MFNLSALMAAMTFLAAFLSFSVAAGKTPTKIPDIMSAPVCSVSIGRYETSHPAPFGPKASKISSANSMPSVSPLYGLRKVFWPANARSLDTMALFCSAVRRRGAIFSSIFMRASLSSSASFLSEAASFSSAPARSFASPALWFTAAIICSCTSASCPPRTITMRVVITTNAAPIAATKSVASIASFHQSTFWLKSWARSVKVLISGILSTSNLVALLIIGCCWALMIGVVVRHWLDYKHKYCNTKIPLDKS